MPIRPSDRTSDSDRQVLLVNNDYDYDADGDAEAYAGGFVGDSHNVDFTPATLHYDDDDDSWRPQERQVLISEAPPDRYNYSYVVFYLLGIVTMAPWNFFVTAENYWLYKFRNTTLNDTGDIQPDLTPLQKSFTCDLTLTASIAGTTFLILNAIYGHMVTLKMKMYSMLSVVLVIFLITTAFVEVNTDRWQEQFFLITLFTVIIINIASATMSGGIFGIAGVFPSQYMSALVSGQALGGIFTALAFILVLAFDTGPKTTAFIYFSVGSALIVLAMAMYGVMTRQPFYAYYANGGDKYEIICETPSHSRCVDAGVPLEPNLREVCGKIYVDAVTAGLLFATSISVYPGVSVLMQSQDYGNGSAWNDVYFLPVVNYLIFNAGDYFGRVLAGIFERPRDNAHTTLLLTVLRTLYVPFFLCSNTNLHHFLPVLVHSDTAFIVMMMTFGISNGYLANITLIMAPRAVKQHEKEMASSIMAACFSLGLALGSMLSMVFVQLL